MEILYKSRGAVVVLKPKGLSSQSDELSETDAPRECAASLAALGEDPTLYPIHRLDKVVSGLLLFARTKKYAAELSALVSGEGIGKEYLAVVEGECPSGELSDYLVKSASEGRARVAGENTPGAKLAKLIARPLMTVISPLGKRTLVSITLKTGRFHQIRAQLSAKGAPIVGDKKYGSRDYLCRTPALFSHKLDLCVLGEHISATAIPEIGEYPWNLFDKDLYEAD